MGADRRAAFGPGLPSQRNVKAPRKILLICWPSADWNLLIPLLDAGKLPHLGSLVERGTIGKITSVQPHAMPIVWTSVATGRYPHAHGVLGTIEPMPDGTGLRPVTGLGRRGKALWNILSQNDYACQVIGWPACHPSEPLPGGVVVTNRFPMWPAGSSSQDHWPLPAESVHPADMSESLARLRKHPGEITGLHLVPFVPRLADMEHADSPLLRRLATIIARTVSLQAASEHCLESKSWDFHAVFLPGIHETSQEFMNFHPPKPGFVDDDEFIMYRHVVEGSYIFHDQLLGRLLNLVGDNVTVMVLSDTGYHSGQFRHNAPLDEPGSPPQREEAGMFVIAGRGLRSDHLAFGSSILDIAPTLLHHCGLAVGRDMDGKVLQELFEQHRRVSWVGSWDEVEGEDGQHPPELRFDPFAVPKPSGSGDEAPEGIRAAQSEVNELRFHRAESLIAAGREGEAIRDLETAWDNDPGESRYAYKLMICYLALERPDLARACFERMLKEKKRFALAARTAWEALDARDPATLSSEEKAAKLKLWKQSRTNLSGMALLQAWLLHGENRPEEAFRVAEAADETKVYNRIGLIKLKADCLAKMKRWQEAETAFERVLDLDPNHAEGHLGLAKLMLDQERYDEAAAHAKQSVSSRYFNPIAHYLYGVSIYRCGNPSAAADALCVAVRQNPYLIGAYERLVLLYSGPFSNPRIAEIWKARLELARQRKSEHEKHRRAGLEKGSAIHLKRTTTV